MLASKCYQVVLVGEENIPGSLEKKKATRTSGRAEDNGTSRRRHIQNYQDRDDSVISNSRQPPIFLEREYGCVCLDP